MHFYILTVHYPLPNLYPPYISLFYTTSVGSLKRNFACSHFQVDFDEWAVCGRFVVKPHVDSTLDESKNRIGSFITYLHTARTLSSRPSFCSCFV